MVKERISVNILAKFAAVFFGLLLVGACIPHRVSSGEDKELVITFGGDVNFATNRMSPTAGSVFKYEEFALEQTTAFLRHEWNGDLNFVNVESVVSDRDHDIQDKAFVFRSHPAQIDHLRSLGVNAFSLANNHAYDHGRAGMEQTLSYFESASRQTHPIIFAGIGRDTDATSPRIAMVQGIRIAMSAISIGSPVFAPTVTDVGMSTLNVAAHFDEVLSKLASAEADFRILSIHHGAENSIVVAPAEADRVRRALREGKVNLLLGHHPHVVRGVAADPESGQATFHSLGNLLFVGGAVRDHLPIGHDYGLLGKAYYRTSSDGVRLTAIEVLPLQNVHATPRPMQPDRARETLAHLSQLSQRTDGTRGVHFVPFESDVVRGVACFGGPYGPAARRVCEK